MLSLLSMSIEIFFSVLTAAKILLAFVSSALNIGSDEVTVLSVNSLSMYYLRFMSWLTIVLESEFTASFVPACKIT